VRIMYPHRIRLRGPWECEPLARAGDRTGPVPEPRRMTIPCRWGEGGLAGFAGRVRFRRRFGYPGRIDDYERVWLTFAGIEGAADVWLNGESLGRHEGACEFDATGLLRQRNELVVEVEAPSDAGGLWGEAALEVRCTAFLRGVRVWAVAAGEGVELHAAGEVVGTAERPLELYMILDRSNVAYAVVEAEPGGRPFHLTAEGLTGVDVAAPHVVRVELVNGATVWFASEQPMALRGAP
jgi:hypothetical protein